jgi:hypothetical protein
MNQRTNKENTLTHTQCSWYSGSMLLLFSFQNVLLFTQSYRKNEINEYEKEETILHII